MSKICAIFGGTKGIGASIARKLISSGFKICVLSSNIQHVEEFIANYTCHQDNSHNAAVIGYPCDVRNEKEIQQAYSHISSTLGPVNVLINAAGITKDALLIKARTSDIENVLDTNLVGSMLTCKHVLRQMMQQKGGTIINIGSIVGSHGNPGQCAYSASKAGLIGFTKSLAKEVGPKGITVNLIAPGYIETQMTESLPNIPDLIQRIPLQRFGFPEEVANVAYFLSTASYITGQVIYVDGGLHNNS